ncbi:MAG: hypothetical protein WA188_18095 [Terriglobales bacterium]
MIITKSAEERKRFWDLCAELKPAREALKQATLVKPQVVEIPFAKLEASPEVRRCGRLHPDGRPCELPAMEGYEECLRHFRWYSLQVPVMALPLPEDALSLQEVLGRAVDMVLSKQITAQEARAVAELCCIMEKNLARCERQLELMARRR